MAGQAWITSLSLKPRVWPPNFNHVGWEGRYQKKVKTCRRVKRKCFIFREDAENISRNSRGAFQLVSMSTISSEKHFVKYLHTSYMSVSLVQGTPSPRSCPITTLQGSLLSLNPNSNPFGSLSFLCQEGSLGQRLYITPHTPKEMSTRTNQVTQCISGKSDCF